VVYQKAEGRILLSIITELRGVYLLGAFGRAKPLSECGERISVFREWFSTISFSAPKMQALN
jgi:hypothetical protein